MDDQIFNVNQITDESFGSMVKRRVNEAESHWDKRFKLKSIRKANNREYLAGYIEDQLVDERYQEIFVDNRQFTSLRTVLPFLTSRLTAPEVIPANGNDASVQFARDFELALQRHVERQQGRAKIRLAVQDVLRGQRAGFLKWRYDARRNNVILEYVPANCIVVGKRSRLHEEPDYLRHTQMRSVGDLLRQFPKKADKIMELFGVERGVPSQLEREYEVNEDWLWVDIDGDRVLIVGWSFQNFVFGKMRNPNWDEEGDNLIEDEMIPFIPFNLLNDGSGWIDQTSFIEQAKWMQRNLNKRGQVIAESAKYGGTGVPIFAKGAISQKDVAKIRFSPIQRVLLDTNDVGKSFTTWQSSDMPGYIIEDKHDLQISIDNIWATPDVLRGEQTNSPTAMQDMLTRDNAEGRHADSVDCIDNAMTRFYQIEAQMMYRYFDETQFYNYLGDDGKFVSIMVDQPTLRRNLGIQIGVQAGSSLPVDRAQKRATILEMLKANKVSVLLAYKELGIFDDPDKAYSQFVMESLSPQQTLATLNKTIQSREAEQDLQAVIAGRKPVDREDIDHDYLKHLNDYLLTNKYHMLKPGQQQRVSQFVQEVLGQAQLKVAKSLDQQPTSEQPGGQQQPDQIGKTMNYRDLPPDVQAQWEQKAGFQPSQLHDEQLAAGVVHTGPNTTTMVQQPAELPAQAANATLPPAQ